MLNAKTLGLTMGIEGDLDTMALTEKIGEKLQRIQSTAGDYPIEYVDDGAVMENKISEDHVDLTIFPAPLWQKRMAARTLGPVAYMFIRIRKPGGSTSGLTACNGKARIALARLFHRAITAALFARNIGTEMSRARW